MNSWAEEVKTWTTEKVRRTAHEDRQTEDRAKRNWSTWRRRQAEAVAVEEVNRQNEN